MTFIVSVTNPGRGSYILGHIDAENAKQARIMMVEKLVRLGVPLYRISQDVVSNTSVSVGPTVFNIVSIPKFDEIEQLNFTALL